MEINGRKRDQKLADNEARLRQMATLLELLDQGQEARFLKGLAKLGPGLSTREDLEQLMAVTSAAIEKAKEAKLKEMFRSIYTDFSFDRKLVFP